MKKPLTLFTPLFLLFVTIGYGCRQPPSPDRILSETFEKINKSPTIRYAYRSRWDNRFNETVYMDSAQVLRTTLDSSPQGFGFYVNRSGNTFWFDGTRYREIRPSEGLIVHHDPEAIKKDTAYFSDLIFFACSPFDLKYPAAFDQITDSLIGYRHFLICRERSEKLSMSDSSKTIIQDRYFHIDIDERSTDRILTCRSVAGDTLQVVDYRFEAVSFEEEPFDFRSVDTTAWPTFTEMSIHDLENDRLQARISKGDRLEQSVFTDLNGNAVKEILLAKPD